MVLGLQLAGFLFALCVIYYILSFQAPSSNQLMHDKKLDRILTPQQNCYCWNTRMALEWHPSN
jgi:hypothetical protein